MNMDYEVIIYGKIYMEDKWREVARARCLKIGLEIARMLIDETEYSKDEIKIYHDNDDLTDKVKPNFEFTKELREFELDYVMERENYNKEYIPNFDKYDD